LSDINSNKLVFLDGLRGLAAFYVLVGHARWLMWEGYSSFLEHINDYSLVERFFVYFFSLFRYGHEMVLFFFVLSGFVIHLRYANQLVSGTASVSFDFFSYIKRRAKRIYPPLIAAIILGFLLDFCGKQLGYSIYQHATPNTLINENIHIEFSFINLLGNLIFLQNTYVPVWGSNTPLWSLKFEWWFYMLYPFLYYLNKKSISSTLFVVLLFSIMVTSQFFIFPNRLVNDIFGALICWWLGTLLADIYVGRIKQSFLLLAPLSIALLVLPFFSKYIPMYKDLFCALGFLGILSIFFHLKSLNASIVNTLEKLQSLGKFSYTLYIIHFPILVFMNGFLLSRNNNQMPKNQYFIVIAILVCCLLAYLLHFITEKQTPKSPTPSKRYTT